MRKYGKLLLVLGILAGSPAWVSADGFLSGLRQNLPSSGRTTLEINQQTAEQVKAALHRARVNGYDITVEVRGDVVKIDGKVRDVTHRALADRACRSVPGITQVFNNLRYVAPGQVQQTSARITDSALQNATYNVAEGTEDAVEQVHFQKPGKRSAKPQTSSQQRQMPQQRTRAAYQPAMQNPGRPAPQTDSAAPSAAEAVDTNSEQAQPLVQRAAPAPAPAAVPPALDREPASQSTTQLVAARPQQESFAPSNQQMAQQIADSLSQTGLQDYPIVIRFENGLATLEGEVSTVQQMQSAAMAASHVPGVQDVRNKLMVQGPIAQTAFGAGGYPNRKMPPQGRGMSSMMMTGMPGAMAPGAPMAAGAPGTPMAPMAMGSAGNYTNPNLPNHAWPAYAAYPNSAAVTYPTQYSASAFPYIGPFYPYPQVPLGWREASLQWDDGFWQLDFEKKHNAWYWLWHPKNWQ